jgi:cytoplasmic iron level regulating protein YaaA (DUF328/UPF0246 family)
VKVAILVPPSEGKAPGGDGPPWAPGTCALASLDADRASVLAALGGGIADAPTLPAMQRYTGVLYRELGWATLPAPARRRAASSLLVVSGLWGVVAPRDPIPAYRLKMSASLPPLGRLSSWWRPRLTAALAEHLRARLVWDLLPNEHSAAWDPVAVPAKQRVRVRVVDDDGRTVGHWNKLVKGALVRRLLLEGADDPGTYDGWVHESGHRVELEEG